MKSKSDKKESEEANEKLSLEEKLAKSHEKKKNPPQKSTHSTSTLVPREQL
ncbi:MAG: hypothetical protein ACI90V_003526 [Bacillariaceae sp.]|jgi:hypothetical protein